MELDCPISWLRIYGLNMGRQIPLYGLIDCVLRVECNTIKYRY